MKNLILGFALLFANFYVQSQNTNVQQEVKTTVKTIKDSDGERKIISTKELKEVQDVELKDAESKTLNKEMILGQPQVSSKVKVTVDGVSRYVDADRTGFYNYNGLKYEMVLDKTGYTIMNPDSKKTFAVVREANNNNYIIKSKMKTYFGHFDADGNLILESYDSKTDTVTREKAELVKE
ncbi:hypothetical protein LZZ90_10285 [Flavobacterium sp. SM15]|uniref:hypothetical protein n=1 Tax=Flavobacterium sp. SM15 TaxID=2908005 RepID=UPI001EDBABAE|nr:hypothetical protein [Flavobacterium sp. SM15]MCG2611893.1 hypothetical protein [Flavobacterium sp. SM15]